MSDSQEDQFVQDTIHHVAPSVTNGDQITRAEADQPRLVQGIPAYISYFAGRAGVMPDIKIVQMSPLRAARILHTNHPRQDIAVLNIGHAEGPSRGLTLISTDPTLEGAARTDEQTLSLQTTLYVTLRPVFYPILDTELIYSPNCLVFRDSHNKALKVEDRFYINVLTCPEISNPKFTKKGVFVKPHKDIMLEKFRQILRLVSLMNIAILVLGPFGCSDYISETTYIEDVADCFVQVYQDQNENFDAIEQIVFTLPRREHRAAFTKVFDENDIDYQQ